MISKVSVYFAHPHAEKDSETKKFLMKLLNMKYDIVIDPFTKAVEKTGVGWLIWEADQSIIDSCDVIFAWIPNRKVVGTVVELEYAKKEKKLIILTAIKSAFIDHLERVWKAFVMYYG